LRELRDQMRHQIEATALSAQDSLRGDAAKLGRDLRARIDAIGQRARQATQDAYTRLRAQLDAEIKSRTEGAALLRDRIANLESSRTADQAQIAQLKEQLNQVRADAEQRASQNELDQVRSEIEENQSDAKEKIDEKIAALRRDADRNQQDVARISSKLAVEKIPFEAGKDHTSELADGMWLHVDGTDVEYRRVSGWMWVASEHRDIWLRGQEALEPVIFYGSKDGQKRELVITSVAKNSVTGYLLLPEPAPAVTRDPGGE